MSQFDCGLRDSIGYGGDAQLSEATRFLWNFHLLDRRRQVRP